jgi:nucleolar protein 9
MPRERKQRGHKHAEKRRTDRLDQEKKFIESQERASLFHDRPKNPFGLLTREDERFFGEVYDEFKKNEWPDEDAKEAFVNNVLVEMKGKELRVATSQVGQFLEVLLPLCPREEVRRIMSVFTGHYVELSRHRFGSFALERIAGHCGLWISEEPSNLGTTTLPDGNEDPQSRSLESLFVDMVGV